MPFPRALPRLSHLAATSKCTPSTITSTRFARPFTSGPKLLLKEDADRSPEEVEAKKQEQLDKQKKGEGEWHESLGSQSESHVKADREDVEDHDEHIGELQGKTKEASEKGEV